MSSRNDGADPIRDRDCLFHLAVTGFFILVTAWLTWPLPARMAGGLSTNPDALLNYWSLAWNFHILPRSPLSLFDANIFFPRPDTLAYSEHLFGVALVSAPAYWLSGCTMFAYNFALAATFVLSGLGMYLLVVELTGSRWAGVFAGVFFLGAPYRFLHLTHIQILSAQWFPFVLLYLVRFLKHGRPRQMTAAAFFAVLQILSCTYYALYLALALSVFAVLAIAYSIRPPRLLDARKTAWLLAGATGIGIVTFPFAQPYLRNRERGFYRRYEDTVQFAADARDYLRPSSFNKTPYAAYLPRQERSEKALFPGFAVLVLAVVGMASAGGRPGRDHRFWWTFFVVLAPLGFILSLGPQMEWNGETYRLPYDALYRFVPGFGGMRVPARLAVLVLLALGPLAGWGLARLGSAAPRLRPWMGCAALLIALFEYQTHSLARLLPPRPDIPAVYTWLSAQPGDFGVLELPMFEDITKEATRLYDSTAHWKRLANGFSGWWPNDYWVLVGRMRYFPTSGGVRFLESTAPVDFIVIHYDEYPQRHAERLRENMERYRGRMPLRARFGSDSVYQLLPEGRTRP